jgi:carbonic anhydrase/acetyltransferase-like protein (isoleucine patch superfamily)
VNSRELDTEFQPELIDESAFIAENATIRGNVRVGVGASVWFGAVIRGDTEAVVIGDRANVQDLCVLHADPGFPCRIGNDVTVGHAAVIHGATIDDGAMVGIRAVVLNGATVGARSLIGAGAVVTEGTQIPPDSLAVGIPAKVIRQLNEQDAKRIEQASTHYVRAGESYRRRTSTSSEQDDS